VKVGHTKIEKVSDGDIVLKVERKILGQIIENDGK
jgi:hypothetical protein